MARPKESNEIKVKKVYPDAVIVSDDYSDMHDLSPCILYEINTETKVLSYLHSDPDLAWSDALTQIRKAKIKARKDKRKPPKVVKEIKKHVGLTMYTSDKAMIVKGFGSVQKFLDLSIREYKDKK